MSRLICYSLTLADDQARADLARQLAASVQSLRQFNASTPAVLFAYGDLPQELERTLADNGVSVWQKGSYERNLARLQPRGWQALARYPLLHRFLNFGEIGSLGPEQVLSLDCDTLFTRDVDELFARYAGPDCCAREEPTCARSHYGYDPEYLDEGRLEAVAASEGIRVPPPFNLGVVLWNNRIWERLPDLDVLFVRYAWRLLLGLALQPARGRTTEFGESDAARLLEAHFAELASPADLRAALQYPSANHWILDEVALWLALGHVPGFTYADFSTADVIQDGEFLSSDPRYVRWILCHYYTQNTERMAQWAGSVVPRAREAAV